MTPFTTLTGIAAPMPLVNIDTDMIIPKQFLKTIHRSGLGKNLFDEMRYTADGSENPDFVLNKPAWREAQIIVAGDNFGCGSSREHAPWALLDYGIRCVISTSFADIFYNNCFKNGILPIVLPQEQVDMLMDDAERGSNAVVTVDLETRTVKAGEGPDALSDSFDIDDYTRYRLLEGLDDIGITLGHEADIAALAALLTEAEAQSPATALSDEPAMTRFRRCRITRSISTARAAKPCSCPTCRAKASRSA